jgi:hypothetical protein
MRAMAAVTMAAVLTSGAFAQEMPRPGPEHAMLKALEGTWTTTMKVGDQETKGKVKFKMVLGGLWLSSELEGELFAQKYEGRSLDTYDPTKKKYFSIWVDSMSAAPVLMEGSYDKEKKEMTMAGEGPGMEGKATKYKSISRQVDADTRIMTMWVGEGKDHSFTVTYKRKK